MDLTGVHPSSDEGLMGRKDLWSFFSWSVAYCPHYSFRGVSDPTNTKDLTVINVNLHVIVAFTLKGMDIYRKLSYFHSLLLIKLYQWLLNRCQCFTA